MNFLMFREITVPLEPFSTDIAFQGCLASVYPDMFSQFIGCEKLLVAIVALEGPVLKMPFLMLSQQVGLCKFLSTFKTLVGLGFHVAGEMLDQQFLLLESSVTSIAHIFSDCIRLIHLLVKDHRFVFRFTFWIKLKTKEVCWMVFPPVSNEIFPVVVDQMTGHTFDLGPFDCIEVVEQLGTRLKDHLTGATLPVL